MEKPDLDIRSSFEDRWCPRRMQANKSLFMRSKEIRGTLEMGSLPPVNFSCVGENCDLFDVDHACLFGK